jgi:hypothetical protein
MSNTRSVFLRMSRAQEQMIRSCMPVAASREVSRSQESKSGSFAGQISDQIAIVSLKNSLPEHPNLDHAISLFWARQEES